MPRSTFLVFLSAALALVVTGIPTSTMGAGSPPPPDGAPPTGGVVLTGKDALGDFSTDAPGVRRRITVDDLAPPYDTPSVNNGPRRMIPRPKDAWPRAPQGFNVGEFATDLNQPRKLITAPNGDIFVAESTPGRIRVLRDADGDGKPEVKEIYASDLNRPFGLAFYPPGPHPTHLYVGNTDSVVRFAYKEGDTRAAGKPETIVAQLPGFARAPRRRPLDPRRRLHRRRQADARRGRLAVERQR